jgi:hypothetical protein
MIATATAVVVIAPRTRDANSQLIDRSSTFAGTDASPDIVADSLPVGLQKPVLQTCIQRRQMTLRELRATRASGQNGGGLLSMTAWLRWRSRWTRAACSLARVRLRRGMASPRPDEPAVEVVGAIVGAGVVVAQCGKSTRLPGGVR